MQQHLVQKYIFDVEFDSENKSFEFQNQLTACVKEKIVNLTDDILTEVSSDQDIGIDKFIVDLGILPLGNFEDNFYSLLKSKLSEKLHLLISGWSSGAPIEENVEFISKHESNLKVLEYFFLYGYLPWSAGKNYPVFPIHKLLNQCTEEKPLVVKNLFTTLFLKEESRLRIIRQLEDSNLWMIISLWTDLEIKMVKKFYSDLIQIYLKKPLVKNYLSEFREMVWKFIVNEVILIGKHKYEDKAWVEGFIAYVSKEINSPVENVIQIFDSSIREKGATNEKTSYETSFPQLVLERMKKNKLHSSKKKEGHFGF